MDIQDNNGKEILKLFVGKMIIKQKLINEMFKD